MEKPFDIFWFGDSGPTWIDAVTTLEKAKVRIETLPQPNSGSYGVLDQRTGRHISLATRSKMPMRKAKLTSSEGSQNSS